ncbi:MAG: hypothetical protein AB7F35_01085 [Acetobacteraceae bacterium]
MFVVRPLMREGSKPANWFRMKRDRYIRASEVNSFVFCKRSWKLGRQDAPTLLEAERARGIWFHAQHGERVQAAAHTGQLATWCAVAAAVLLVLGVLLAIR